MPNNAKLEESPKKQLTGSIGEMIKNNLHDSVIKLILDLNLAVVKGSEAERKINSYLNLYQGT